LPTDSERREIPKPCSEHAIAIREVIERGRDVFAQQLEQGEFAEDQIFEVLRQSLANGLQRFDDFGSQIANGDPDEGTFKSLLECFIGGILQVSVAARLILETLPVPLDVIQGGRMFSTTRPRGSPQ